MVPSTAKPGSKVNWPARSKGTFKTEPGSEVATTCSDTTPVRSVTVPLMVGSNVTPSVLVVPPGAVSLLKPTSITGGSSSQLIAWIINSTSSGERVPLPFEST